MCGFACASRRARSRGGFTVRNEKLPELVSRLKSIAEAQLSGKDLHPTVTADMEVSLSQLNFDLLKHLAYFEPTGYGNPSAIFVSRDVKVKSVAHGWGGRQTSQAGARR